MNKQKRHKLKKLFEKKQNIEAQIQSERAQEATIERNNDKRRKTLIGSVILNKVENGTWSIDQLQKMMDSYLIHNRDRVLFDLPLKKKSLSISINEIDKLKKALDENS